MPTTLLAMILCAQTTPNGVLDAESLSRILATIHVPIDDVRFEYEGSYRFLGTKSEKDLGPEGIVDTFSGRFAWRRDGAVLVDCYHRNSTDGKLTRRSLAILKGKAEIYDRPFDQVGGAGVIQEAQSSIILQTSSPGSMFSIAWIRPFLSDPHMYMTHEGSVELDGRRVELLAFAYKKPNDAYPTLKNASGFRMWIDLERGGLVLKQERYDGNDTQLASRMTVEIDRFPLSSSKSVWLPIAYTGSGFVGTDDKNNMIYKNNPTSVEKGYLLKTSVMINSHPGDSVFSVNYKPGTPITDRLKREEFSFGQQKVPKSQSRQQMEEELREAVARADAQSAELKASTSARPRFSDWTRGAPWVVSIAAFLLLVVVLIRCRLAP